MESCRVSHFQFMGSGLAGFKGLRHVYRGALAVLQNLWGFNRHTCVRLVCILMGTLEIYRDKGSMALSQAVAICLVGCDKVEESEP